MNSKPAIITFQQKGKKAEGHISIAHFAEDIPFEVKRAFWTYGTPDNILRGKHAHYETKQVMIAVCGQIEVKLRNARGKSLVFLLDSPDKGLFVPPNYWHTMKYSPDAVQLVLASTDFREEDYIRSPGRFLEYWGSDD